MDQNKSTFERIEKKYLLKNEGRVRLLRAIAPGMRQDAYGKELIENVYYDTPDFDLIRMSLDRPAYKEKLRLRGYGVPKASDTVFVELKKKFDGVVYKRRVEMTLQEAERYLLTGRHPGRDGQILRELDYALNLYGVQAAMFLSYERTAFTGKDDPAFRVTLDQNIRYRLTELALGKGPYGERLLPTDVTLMEVKAPGALPIWFARALSNCAIYPVTFSKYGAAYRRLCEKGREGVQIAS